VRDQIDVTSIWASIITPHLNHLTNFDIVRIRIIGKGFDGRAAAVKLKLPVMP